MAQWSKDKGSSFSSEEAVHTANGDDVSSTSNRLSSDAELEIDHATGLLTPRSHHGSSVHHPHLEYPMVTYGCSQLNKKGEDFYFINTDIERVLPDGTSSLNVFAIFDGHNGPAAAEYAQKNLLKEILSAMPPTADREEWLDALNEAMVTGFVKIDKAFNAQVSDSYTKGEELRGGCTATIAIVDDMTVTVASVGDSRCILETQTGGMTLMSLDHRLDTNKEEVERIKQGGGQLGRLVLASGEEVGPLRVWPGGLCLSRSLGDLDVGPHVVPVPHVKQVKLPQQGGRLIIASDGVWDRVKSEEAMKLCRNSTAVEAAKKLVQASVRKKGLMDDTTCIVVDIRPATANGALPPKEKRSLKKIMGGLTLGGKKTRSEDDFELDRVVVLYEEHSPYVSDRSRKPSRDSTMPRS